MTDIRVLPLASPIKVIFRKGRGGGAFNRISTGVVFGKYVTHAYVGNLHKKTMIPHSAHLTVPLKTKLT